MPYIDLNGINTYYEIQGSGPPVVFIHGGYGGAGSTLAPPSNDWVDSLTDCFTIVTYDRRSCGRSTYPDINYTFDDIVKDLAGLITNLHLHKPFLIGSSAGGPIAISYALTNQSDISGLILPNTSARLWEHPDRIAPKKILLDRLEYLSSYGEALTYELIQRQQAGPNKFTLSTTGPGPQTNEARINAIARARVIHEKLTTISHNTHRSYVLGELRNLGTYLALDLRDSLKKLKTPTLILHGDADTQVPYTLGQELSVLIPHASFVTIHGAGHGIMSRTTAIDEIRSFLLQ
ncbi:MAG: alpha/beta hydrolase [SAR202 cluster bacterium]|nr:alpha/beta hydrolase [SAR202 cluster bacterium]